MPYTTLLSWRDRFGSGGRPRLLPVEVEREAVLEVQVGGSTVRVEAGFDAEHLARVVRALRAC